MIWTDNLSNQRARGAGVLLRSLEGDTIECAVRLQFSMTNNEAEYEAILSGLDLAKAVGVELAVIHCNSQVVVRHINGNYKAKSNGRKKYLSMVKGKMNKEFLAKFVQISRKENE